MKYLIILVTAVVFSACGGGDSSTSEMTLEKSITEMEYGKVYTVNKGDKLVKTTPDTVVKITQKTQGDTTEVVLLEGNAQIIR